MSMRMTVAALAAIIATCVVPTQVGATENPTMTEMPKPAKSGHAAVNGVNYYYAVYGKGEPLLLLHGGLGQIEMFGPNLALAREEPRSDRRRPARPRPHGSRQSRDQPDRHGRRPGRAGQEARLPEGRRDRLLDGRRHGVPPGRSTSAAGAAAGDRVVPVCRRTSSFPRCCRSRRPWARRCWSR